MISCIYSALEKYICTKKIRGYWQLRATYALEKRRIEIVELYIKYIFGSAEGSRFFRGGVVKKQK